ncbi:uncharacterized protein BP5553_07876 [Venustampulla echinocandica]|uniref:Uncharacterized protein n=1 Tax=Venustampulla echinocandica TaxID=2656787 RepID=A0A370THT7_9HELO|nr:uncharacterized protein BP5553_07876 [Venustampulla echinocandica]RDL34748.1 hypothetical protein BP5553_07876 [Venustampulla echinocandica]
MAPGAGLKLGYKKIKFGCEQSIKDGLDWIWVDTCCIDKSSTAELSEAINSMFSWYKNAWVCYAYLSDVPGDTDLSRNVSSFALSRWFTRGWTLQELIASPDVLFYSASWQFLGSKLSLCELLTEITGIDEEVLKYRNLESTCVAKKMSWAAKRETTRIEDAAYCLLGIFDVNMPLLYGEGSRAFARLQEEIMKVSDDQSLFAWGLPQTPVEVNYTMEMRYPYQFSELQRVTRLQGILAESPADFANSRLVRILPDVRQHNKSTPLAYNRGVNIQLPLLSAGGAISELWNTDGRVFSHHCFYEETLVFAILDCTIESDNVYHLALPLRAWSPHYFGRFSLPFLVNIAKPDGFIDPDSTVGDMRSLQIKSEQSDTEFLGGKFIIHSPIGCQIRGQCASSAMFFGRSPLELVSYGHIPGTHAILVLTPVRVPPFAIALGGYVRSDLGNELDLWVSYIDKEIAPVNGFSDLLNENTSAFKLMRNGASTNFTKHLSGTVSVTVTLGEIAFKFRHWVVQVNMEFQYDSKRKSSWLE